MVGGVIVYPLHYQAGSSGSGGPSDQPVQWNIPPCCFGPAPQPLVPGAATGHSKDGKRSAGAPEQLYHVYWWVVLSGFTSPGLTGVCLSTPFTYTCIQSPVSISPHLSLNTRPHLSILSLTYTCMLSPIQTLTSLKIISVSCPSFTWSFTQELPGDHTLYRSRNCEWDGLRCVCGSNLSNSMLSTHSANTFCDEISLVL